MGERVKSLWCHQCRTHPCVCVSDRPGLPLTTGEGTTASGAIQWLRMMNDDAPQMSTTKLRSGQVLAELEAALAECDRLREQLDAARQTLADVMPWLVVPSDVSEQHWETLGRVRAAARAALGVEGAE